MSDDIEALYRLRDELDQVQQQMANAAADPESIRAEDPTGAVTVTVSPDGSDVSVSLTSMWKASIRPDALAATISSTYGALMAKRLESWAAAMAPDAERPRASAVFPSYSSRGASLFEEVRENTPEQSAELHARTKRFLDAMFDGIDDVVKSISERVGQRYSGGSEARAAVTVGADGTLLMLSINEEWASSASAESIASAVNTAYRAARSQAASSAPASVFDGTAFEQYADILNDPQALVRRLNGKE